MWTDRHYDLLPCLIYSDRYHSTFILFISHIHDMYRSIIFDSILMNLISEAFAVKRPSSPSSWSTARGASCARCSKRSTLSVSIVEIRGIPLFILHTISPVREAIECVKSRDVYPYFELYCWRIASLLYLILYELCCSLVLQNQSLSITITKIGYRLQTRWSGWTGRSKSLTAWIICTRTRSSTGISSRLSELLSQIQSYVITKQ